MSQTWLAPGRNMGISLHTARQTISTPLRTFSSRPLAPRRDRRRSFLPTYPRHLNRLAKYAPRPEYHIPSPGSPLPSSVGSDEPTPGDVSGRVTATEVIEGIRPTPRPPLEIPPNAQNRPTVRWDEIRAPTTITAVNKKAVLGAGNDLPAETAGSDTPNSTDGARNAAGSGDVLDRRKIMTVLGIEVPPKPIPPGSEECCMSGCVNCVYTIYADDLLEYNNGINSALVALQTASPPIPLVQWPLEIRTVAERRAGKGLKGGAVAGDGGSGVSGGSKNVVVGETVVKDSTKEEMKSLLEGVDPALRAFLEMEARLKARAKGVGTQASVA